MRRSTLETIAILAWVLLLPLVATWLASQGKTSATLLLGVMAVATIAWVMHWVRRPWAQESEVLEPLPIRLSFWTIDMSWQHAKIHSMGWRVQESMVLHDAVLEGLEDDDDGA